MSGPRLWGFWTEGKLEMLRDYLAAFGTASKGASHRTYLDLFAGQPENRARDTGVPIEGSPVIALETAPTFTHLGFFELHHAADLDEQLRARYPHRVFRVIPGDCNATVPQMLTSGWLPKQAPTFAFIDPNGPDCAWETLAALAEFKRHTKTKIELWILFPVGMFKRELRLSASATPEAAERITRLFGSSEWMAIHEARRRGQLTASSDRDEYVNLLRWRLQHVLGYRRTHSFLVRNTKNTPMYAMVFATDHEVGHRVMSHLYAAAADRFAAMASHALRMRRTQGQLFDIAPDVDPYVHEEPLPPYGVRGRA